MSPFIRNDKNRPKTESTVVVAQSQENGDNKEWLPIVMVFWGEDDENILKLDCGDFAQLCEYA